jgi:PKD repeat protein
VTGEAAGGSAAVRWGVWRRNGNGRGDFADAVLFFSAMDWIAANEPAAAFDCNGNGRIDFADVVWLFGRL